MAIFGDSMKSSTICNSYTLRWRGHVLPSRDRLPGVDDVGPDGTATAGRAMSQTSTHLMSPMPLVPRVAMRPLRAHVTVHVGGQPGPVPSVGYPRSGA